MGTNVLWYLNLTLPSITSTVFVVYNSISQTSLKCNIINCFRIWYSGTGGVSPCSVYRVCTGRVSPYSVYRACITVLCVQGVYHRALCTGRVSPCSVYRACITVLCVQGVYHHSLRFPNNCSTIRGAAVKTWFQFDIPLILPFVKLQKCL